MTPLHTALEIGNFDVCKMIIEKCKYISKKTNKGNSNMHVAAASETDCP